jgi:type II secretory pathway pseudopilin PulG
MEVWKNPSPRRGEAGMTLIEVSVAAGVLLVTIVLLLGGVVDISRTSDVVSTRAIAGGHVNSVLEEVQRLGFAELLEYHPPLLKGLGVTERVTVACLDEDGQPVPLPITDASVADRLPNPLEVRVSVTWRDRQGRAFGRHASALIGR